METDQSTLTLDGDWDTPRANPRRHPTHCYACHCNRDQCQMRPGYSWRHNWVKTIELNLLKPQTTTEYRLAVIPNLNRIKQEIAEHDEKDTMPEPRVKKHSSHELGAREFTLTYSPKWMEDNEARIQMEKAIQKLLRYYSNEIIELRAVGETGSAGLSHIHCFYKLNGGLKITDKNFKRAWKYWNPKKRIGFGFEGGHHANVRSEADFQGYIDKEIDSSWFHVHVNNRDKET